jgi:protein-tyrosine kinase
MTRLTEALNRANHTSSQGVLSLDDNVSAWQFPAADVDADRGETTPEPARETPAPPAGPGATPLANPVVLVPRLNARERSRVVVGDAPDPALVEQYRHLAAVLHHAQSESRCRSVMVTSAVPSEGKTLTATNLALTLSESYQRRVLLIDADLRRPRVNEMFGLPVTDGLTESLSNPRSGRLPVHQITPTLWVLTAGRAVADPMSTLVSTSMKQLLDEARDAFDWVVVDTPPIAILPDANLLASMIDTALLVVSANTTPYPMVQRAAEAIGPQRILGVVLNRAEAAGMPQGYGYYQRPQARAARPRWRRWFGRSRGVPHVQ